MLPWSSQRTVHRGDPVTTYTLPIREGFWMYTEELIDDFVISAHVQHFGEGWIITDLGVVPYTPDWQKRIKKSGGPLVSSWLPKHEEGDEPFPGVTSGTLTSLRFDAVRKWVAEEILKKTGPREAPSTLQDDLAQTFRPGRRARRTPLLYAQMASFYLDVCQRTDKVYEEMAKGLHLAPSTIRDIVKEARKQEMLTRPPGQGIRGGELTDKAKHLLDLEVND
jgi:hypothetical protein